ncbi:MAG: heme-binding protein [Planctomycetaceae bacterium]
MVRRAALAAWLLVASCNGGAALAVVPLCPGPVPLAAAEIETLLAQAAARAAADATPFVLTVVNRDGVVVGAFAMAGVPAGFVDSCRAKARTAAFLSSNQHAFSTRTARFIIQDNFPPGLPNTPGGPLYGVQFSSLACSDVVGEIAGSVTTTGNGLSGDFGSVPLYRGGCLVGAIAADGGGDDAFEERSAWAGSMGFRPSPAIFGENVFVDGVSLPFLREMPDDLPPAPPLASFAGALLVPPLDAPPDLAFPTAFFGGLLCEVRYPVLDSPAAAATKLLAADVMAILDAAAARSERLRAAIRLPLGVAARVFVSVVDPDGVVLGSIRTPEATLFSFDVSVQKARTAAFFSSDAAAITTRALGFLAQGFFPPGIAGAPEGPLRGLQEPLSAACGPAPLPLANGITIFPGGIPLYKGGVLVGAIGVSGDGVDQDDFIAAAGADLFPPPAVARADALAEAALVAHLKAAIASIAGATADPAILAAVAASDARLDAGLQGIRLPYVKFPREPFR